MPDVSGLCELGVGPAGAVAHGTKDEEKGERMKAKDSELAKAVVSLLISLLALVAWGLVFVVMGG